MVKIDNYEIQDYSEYVRSRDKVYRIKEDYNFKIEINGLTYDRSREVLEKIEDMIKEYNQDGRGKYE